MRKYLLPILLFCSTAHAQLQVTAPAPQPCPVGSAPVLGIALDTVLDGSYGQELSGELKDALELKGFQVVPDYAYPLVDKATIGIKGEAHYWKNIRGEESSRIGNVHLKIYDLESNKTLLNLDQKAAVTVFGATRPEVLVQNIVSVISQKFCQQ